MFLMLATIITVGLSVAHIPTSHTSKYKIDPAQSTIVWTGKKVTGQHTGNISIASGTVMVNHGKMESVNLTIDMKSITNTDLDEDSGAKLLGHLKSDDFFSVESHPEASFSATSFTIIPGAKEGQENFNINGDLTIKGITHPLSFPARIDVGNGQLTAIGKATFDRSKYEVKYGSGSFFKGLGDNLIYDDVEITFALVAAE